MKVRMLLQAQKSEQKIEVEFWCYNFLFLEPVAVFYFYLFDHMLWLGRGLFEDWFVVEQDNILFLE